MVHGGPAAPSSTEACWRARRAASRGTKAHCGGAGGRGRQRKAHQGQNRAAQWRGCASGGEEWNTTSVLGVGRLRAQISGARWGKMLQWKWLRWWHLL
jgi:hypothetical protein